MIEAVKTALGAHAPAEEPSGPVVVDAGEVFVGFGLNNTGRIGPGKDDKGVQVYSINQVFAAVLFDAQGKILYAKLDQLEVATPNYDGEGMPHFSGFPGQIPYLYDSDHDGKIDGVLETDDAKFQAEISGWLTKRGRGESYKMGVGTWASQMDAYEALFIGKTVAELEEWFAKYTSDRNGRPLKDGSTNEADKAKYDALTPEDKALLADVTSAATMSLNDSHGNILGALKAAYENRQAVTAPAASLGLGLNFTGRIGPGKDATETQVYSINQVFFVTLFDAEGRIVQVVADQLEVATPNYDGEGMPHFPGFQARAATTTCSTTSHRWRLVTNNDSQARWEQLTKRQRGESKMTGHGPRWTPSGLFAGKTVEIEWLPVPPTATYPLKDGSSNRRTRPKCALSPEDGRC